MARRKTSSLNKAIGYVRVSTVMQGEQGHSIYGQIARMRKKCEEEGLQLVEVVEEVASSTAERDKFEAVQQRISDDEARVLVGAKIDRLGRSMIHLAHICEWAEREKVSILSVDEGWQIRDGKITDPMLPFRIASAHVDLYNIRERTRHGLAAARAKGVKLGRKPLNPELAARCYELRFGQLLKWQSIVDLLDREGVVTASGRKVNLGTLHGMVSWYARENRLPFVSGRIAECVVTS